MRSQKRVWIVVFAIVLSSAILQAQTGGTVSGIVEDESSAAIPGALPAVNIRL